MANSENHNIFSLLKDLPPVQKIMEWSARPNGDHLSVWAPSNLRALISGAIYQSVARKVLIVTASQGSADLLGEQLTALRINNQILYSWETLPFERESPAPEITAGRFSALDAFENRRSVLIVPMRSLLQPLPDPEEKLHHPLVLKKTAKLDLTGLAEKLTSWGWERVSKVEERGQFSVRGGIIDLFPPQERRPYRIELWGEDIDSIRFFDSLSQLSVEQTDEEIVLFPLQEVLLNENKIEQAVTALEQAATSRKWLFEDLDRIKQLQHFPGLESYLPFMGLPHRLNDYLSDDCLIFLDEPAHLTAAEHRLHEEESNQLEELVPSGLFPEPPHPFYASSQQILGEMPVCKLESLVTPEETDTALEATPISLPPGDFQRLREFIEKLKQQTFKVIFSGENTEAQRRTHRLLQEEHIDTVLLPEITDPLPTLSILPYGPLNGFLLKDLKIAFIGRRDFLGAPTPTRRRSSEPESKPLTSLADIAPGDLVVHRIHGIARFTGLSQQKINDSIHEYLVLEYSQGDRLFIPADNLNRVSKYIGTGEKPHITRLGSGEWTKAKKAAKKRIRKLAIDLLKLYSEREKAVGHPFPSETPWQHELEDSFQYEETPDQSRSIQEIMNDMESPRPMDRLLCGDVGYGKTEVAIRASFKAATDGTQIMVLVPTTLLAQQHFATFSERLSPFPVSIRVLSRFQRPPEQKRTVSEFNKGQVDILIGTHRLLQKDIKPKNLGLLIIDEEHRFGVGQKEKIKAIKKEVDVLALTATPIPRTLQMSLSGIRDLSIMETPPPNRFPVSTFVGIYDDSLIRAAIRRELARDGQLYYVYNKVQGIEQVAERLSGVVPEARIGISHGQMPEQQLDQVMKAFRDHKIDVLLTTTIIESGLDIPSANTLIVENAESFGLAQLYQLRGRVGRSHHRAYAYFITRARRLESMTETARQRLQALSELAQLGSGLKLALKDLEIRGAGNLLGAEQSGVISAVGFELYSEMLQEAVTALTEYPELEQIEQLWFEPEDKSDLRIDLPIPALIPATYIAEDHLRIEAYKRIADARSDKELDDVKGEFKDRFGPYPQEVDNLITIASMRQHLRNTTLDLVSWRRNRLVVQPIALEAENMDAMRSIAPFSYNKAEKSLSFECPDPVEATALTLKFISIADEIALKNKTVA